MVLIKMILLILNAHFFAMQNAKEIVKAADEKMRGTTSHAEIIIKTIRPSWSRELAIKIWAKGTDLSLIQILSPAKEKGITYLKRKKEVWTWMPSLEKTIKLPPSMMSQSWMGTDFTNDDLVKESSIVNDYDHYIIGDTTIDYRKCYIIEMIPKSNVAVVWNKLIVCIDKKDFMELSIKFYDEENKLINTMNAFDVKTMDNRIIPTRFEMTPEDKKNQKTVMIYKTVEYNKPIEDDFFTTEKMKQLSN